MYVIKFELCPESNVLNDWIFTSALLWGSCALGVHSKEIGIPFLFIPLSVEQHCSFSNIGFFGAFYILVHYTLLQGGI